VWLVDMSFLPALITKGRFESLEFPTDTVWHTFQLGTRRHDTLKAVQPGRAPGREHLLVLFRGRQQRIFVEKPTNCSPLVLQTHPERLAIKRDWNG